MYLTVKEAIEISGKSQTTIHRLCQKNEDTKYIKKENNKYLVDRDFLLKKYPADETSTPEQQINPATGKDLLESLTEKNLQITELTISNKTLIKKLEEKSISIEKLKEELFDNQHELAEAIDANSHMEKELLAVKDVHSIFDEDGDGKMEFEISSARKDFLFQALTITGSLMVLVTFIYLMYYFVK